MNLHQCTKEACDKNIDINHTFEATFQGALQNLSIDKSDLFKAANEAAMSYTNVVNTQVQHLQSAKKQELHSKLTGNKKGAKFISKYLKGEPAKPLQHLKRTKDCKYGKKGTYSHNPMEVDEIARDAWQEVYNGRSGSLHKRTWDFCGNTKVHTRR